LNDATVTLNVSGFGAKPLRGLTGKDLLAGVLIEGTPYTASYYAATQEWILHGAYGDPYGIPLGGGLPYFGTTAPNTAFAFPSGQTLSRTAYASLFALFGTRFGTGDGSTTFNIPDLRGRGLSFLDNMGGTAAGRITTAGSSIDGTTLGATGGAEAVTLTTAQIPAHTHPNTLSDPGHAHLYGLGTGGTAGGAGSGVAVITVNTSTSANVTGITINNASQGGGGAHTNMSPTFMANCIIRIM
jgi:microcystin-dependent protein